MSGFSFWRPTVVRLRRTIAVETIARVIADALLVSAGLFVAFFLHYIGYLWTSDAGSATARNLLDRYLALYAADLWPLLLISILTFWVSGFYSRGRAYQSRFKALIIVQAVGISHLAFASLQWFLANVTVTPRAVVIASWGITTLLLLGARLWSAIWKYLASIEQSLGYRPAPNKMRSILVIGGAGYIGSALLPLLLEKGYRVRLLDLFVYGDEAIGALLDHPNLEIMRADFRQVDKVVEAVRGMDAIVHLGAIVGDPACELNADLTIEINLMATRMIAEVAKGSGVRRLVFASTCSVYGASDLILDERSELNPVSLYARSKIASELVLLNMVEDNFAPVILRFATIYGLSGRSRFDLVVNLLSAKAVTDGKITLFGGDQWRPFIHVEDAARGVLAALEAAESDVRGQIFNIGSNAQNLTLKDVADLIQAQVPSAEILELGSDGDRRNYRVNCDKAARSLKFSPQWEIEQGISQVIGAVQSGLVRDYRDSKHSNVKFLSETANGVLQIREDWVDKLLVEECERIARDTLHSARRG